MKNLKKFWPIAIILLAWLIIASPYFIKHKIPYPSTFQVSFFTPWNSYPQYQIPTKNPALSDVVDQIFPWKHFTIQMLKKGQIPLWNPYSFTGNPHLADSQTAVLSPFNLLFFLLPFIDAWSLLILLQPLIAAIGTYLLLRQLSVSKEGSVLSSIAFMFCGFIVVWMPYGTLSMAIAFLPLALYAIEKNSPKIHYPSLSLLPISLAISFFSGHIQTSVYFTLYTLAYIIYKYFVTKKTKPFINIISFFLLGLLISSIQLFPTLQLYHQASRSQEFSTAGGIPWQYLITSIAPDFFGNPVTRNDWFGKYAEWSSFIGIIPLLLALLSLLHQKQKKQTLFFLFAGIIALILSMDTPLQNILVSLKLPIFSTSIPSRIIVLFTFSFAVLAGFGLDSFKELLQKHTYKKFLPVILAVATTLLLIWITLIGLKVLPPDKSHLAEKNLILPSILFLFFVTIPLLTRYTSLRGTKQSPTILKKMFQNSEQLQKQIILGITILLIAATLFDSLKFAQKWLPFDDSKYIFPNLPVITAMQQKVGQGRVYGNFGSYIDTYYQLPSIEGYDPLYINRYAEFIQSAKTGQWTPPIHSIVNIDKLSKNTPRVLDLLGVTILFHRKEDTFTNWTFPIWGDKQRYLPIYTDDKFQLYQNTTALPRAKLFYNYEVITEDKKIIQRFYDPKFDYRNKLILEKDPQLNPTNNSQGQAEITSYTPNQITIHVTSATPGLLFLSDSDYPTWQATINEQPTQILRADYTFRAVIIPQGKSTVTFTDSF